MFALAAAGMATVALVAWLLGGFDAPDPTGTVLSARPEVTGPLGLAGTAAAEGQPEALAPAADGSAGEPEPPPAAPEAAPLRTLRGRVARLDGGRLPPDTRVFASRRVVPPLLFGLREVDRFGGTAELLRDGQGGWTLPPPDPLHALQVQPDDSGRFELQAPDEPVWLGVQAADAFLETPVQVDPGESGELLLLLSPAARLVVQVVDAEGRPAAGVPVSAGSPFDPYTVMDSSSRMAALGPALTDADGLHEYVQVPPGVPILVAAMPRDRALQPGRARVAPLAAGRRAEVRVQLLPAAEIHGRVTFAGGEPVADARLTLRPGRLALDDMGIQGPERVTDALTDEAGAFAFRGVPAGLWDVILTQPGLRLTRVTGLELAPGQRLEGVQVLADAGLSVAGHVLDESGRPLAGVRVQAYEPPSLVSFGANFDRELRVPAVTGEDGAFRCGGLEPGKVRIAAEGAGHQRLVQDAAAGDEGLELRLVPLASLSGIVVALGDGEPVSAFRIGLVPSEGVLSAGDFFGTGAEEGLRRVVRPQRFTQREDGTFTVEGIGPGTYDVTVEAAGHGPRTEREVEVPRGGRRGLVVMLEPESVVHGRVVDLRSGLPLAGASVRVAGGGSVADMLLEFVKPAAQVRTDAQGGFRLGGLAAGPLKLGVEAAGHRALGLGDLELAPGEVRDLGTLRLSTGAAVWGKVSDERGPLVDVSVRAFSSNGAVNRQGRTDAQGFYRIEGLPAGTFSVMRMDFAMELSGSVMDVMRDLRMETVTLAEDEERRVDLGVVSDAGTRLLGTVRDVAGPVPGAMVALIPESRGGRMGFATTDAEGRYEIGRIVPGRYAVSVAALEGGSSVAPGQPGSAVVRSLSLSAGVEHRHDVTLPGGTLEGVVVAADGGAPIRDARVVLDRSDAGALESDWLAMLGGRVGETYADAQGRFRFRHLPGGTYAATAGGKGLLGTGAGGWAQRRVEGLQVLEGGQGFSVRLELEPAAVIAGSTQDLSGQALSGVGVWVLQPGGAPRSAFSEVVSDAGGAYEVGDLPAGAWTLAFMDDDHALTIVRDVPVREGERTPLDVRLPPGVALRLDLAGRPAAAVQVSLSGPGGALPVRLVSPDELAGLAAGAGTLLVGTYAPGTYHLRVMSGADTLLDAGVTLAGGSGSKVLELPPP